MAQMIPAEAVFPHDSEREVFEALRDQLDDSYTVFHSYDIIRSNLDDGMIDGEIDFIVLHPTHGLLVLEVKGGELACRGGQWYQSGRAMKQQPLVQAKSNKYALLDFLERRMGAKPPIAHGHALCFPETFSGLDRLPAGMDGITAGGDDVPRLSEWIPKVMSGYRKANQRTVDAKLFRAIRLTIMQDFELGSSLGDRIRQGQRRFFALTEAQCGVLDALAQFKQLLVEGCAGSGKTVMAVKKARALAAQGHSVLLLCFNRMLAAELATSVADREEHVVACTYHQFCVRTLDAAGKLPSLENQDSEFWDETIPELLAEYLAESPIQFDALIVDEGQDFREDYWITLQELVRPDGWFYIFYDPVQNLRETRLQLPSFGFPPVSLKTNCRNSRAIFDLAQKLTESELVTMDDVPAGRPLETIQIPNPKLRAKAVGKLLHRLVKDEGVACDQIVILGATRLAKTCLADGQAGGYWIAEGGELVPNTVPYFTYMKYKGLECPIVVLLDVDRSEERWLESGYYAAITRASHGLIIVTAQESE